MMKIFATVVVNNDIKVSVNLDGKTDVNRIPVEKVAEKFEIMKFQAPPIKSFYLLEVYGTLQLDASQKCETCETDDSEAEFAIQYVKGKPTEWAFFYTANCYDYEHINQSTYTPEKLNNIVDMLKTYPNWDDKFVTVFQNYAKILNSWQQ